MAAPPIYSKDIDEKVETIVEKEDAENRFTSYENDDNLDEDSTVPGQEYFVVSTLSRGITSEDSAEMFDLLHFLMNMSGDEILTLLGKRVSEAYFEKQQARSSEQLDINANDPSQARERLWGEEIRMADHLKFNQEVPKHEDELFENCLRNCTREYNLFKKNYKIYLEQRWNKYNGGQVRLDRGFKMRGAYKNMKKAQERADVVRREDGGRFKTYIGQVGKWLPFDPNPIQAKEYNSSDKKLNELIANYKKEQDKAVRSFELRKEILKKQGQKMAMEREKVLMDAKEKGIEFPEPEPVPEQISPLETKLITADEYLELIKGGKNMDMIGGGGSDTAKMLSNV